MRFGISCRGIRFFRSCARGPHERNPHSDRSCRGDDFLSLNTAHNAMMLEKIFLDGKRKNSFSFFLYPLSKIYQKCIDLRHFLYRSKVFKEYTSPVFTVCVGSIFVGGSGKTPFVRLLLEHLGEDVFVLSRGYRNLDEPLFYRNCVIQKDRVRGAKDCLEKGAKAIIMDDGLQH
ncbi:MAG: hypothetical protein FJZ60_04435, partial [Chlamydiae bacterium]|nr:hypothetical protein [Chlamydiota bacterium]